MQTQGFGRVAEVSGGEHAYAARALRGVGESGRECEIQGGGKGDTHGLKMEGNVRYIGRCREGDAGGDCLHALTCMDCSSLVGSRARLAL